MASLAGSIVSADEGRHHSPDSETPRGWAGLVERDRRGRERSHPNPVGGYLNILYPWRLYIAVVGGVIANLIAFACAVAASLLLGHVLPAALSAVAVACWLALARRTFRARRQQPAPTY